MSVCQILNRNAELADCYWQQCYTFYQTRKKPNEKIAKNQFDEKLPIHFLTSNRFEESIIKKFNQFSYDMPQLPGDNPVYNEISKEI